MKEGKACNSTPFIHLRFAKEFEEKIKLLVAVSECVRFASSAAGVRLNEEEGPAGADEKQRDA